MMSDFIFVVTVFNPKLNDKQILASFNKKNDAEAYIKFLVKFDSDFNGVDSSRHVQNIDNYQINEIALYNTVTLFTLMQQCRFAFNLNVGVN